MAPSQYAAYATREKPPTPMTDANPDPSPAAPPPTTSYGKQPEPTDYSLWETLRPSRRPDSALYKRKSELPMTPEDNNAIRAIVREEVTTAKTELTAAMTTATAESEARLTEAMRDMQSEILRGLAAFAKGNFARFHTVEST
jgi:hypothetical protein